MILAWRIFQLQTSTIRRSPLPFKACRDGLNLSFHIHPVSLWVKQDRTKSISARPVTKFDILESRVTAHLYFTALVSALVLAPVRSRSFDSYLTLMKRFCAR